MARRTFKITRQDIERAVRTLSRPGTREEIEALAADLEGKHYGAQYPYEVESFIVGALNDLRGHGGWVGTGFSEQPMRAAPHGGGAGPDDVFSFKMTNLPGDPWKDYYVLEVDDDSGVKFSSLPPRIVQHNAEHFWMTLDELASKVDAGIAMGPSDRQRLAVHLATLMAAAGWDHGAAETELRHWVDFGFEALTEAPLAAITEAMAEMGV